MPLIVDAIRLALAFIRVPRLFGFLFLFPLVLSFFIVYTQLIITGLYLGATSQGDSKAVETTLKHQRTENLVKKVLLRSDGTLGPIQVCRWRDAPPGSEYAEELPPDCTLDRFDVAVKVESPATFDPEGYVKILNGNFRRLHLCRTCVPIPDVMIDLTSGPAKTNTYSFWGIVLMSFVEFTDERIDRIAKARASRDRIKKLLGPQFLHASGFQKPTNIEDISKTLLVISNITILIIIALWLALKAHRKVLEYFSNSGALLPMVAASGKSSFYCSIWVLTLIRVAFFLLGSVPLCYYTLQTFIDMELSTLFFDKDGLAFILWVLALVTGLSLATLIASISDLKHRHDLLSFLYRYIPLLVSLAGGVVWGLTFIVETRTSHYIRTFFASLPLLGMVPTLLAPIFTPDYMVLATHTLLTFALLAFAARSNTRWFAAHLEEL